MDLYSRPLRSSKGKTPKKTMKPRTSSPHRTVSLGTFFWSLHSQPTRVCSRRCLHMSSSSQTHALALRQQVAQFEKTVDPSNSSQVAALNDMRKALSDLERTRGVWSNPASTNERDWNAAPASAPSANSGLAERTPSRASNSSIGARC